MAESNAKMHLREFVREEDINLAIRMELESFVETQKYSIMKDMRNVCTKLTYFNLSININRFDIFMSCNNLYHSTEIPEVSNV